MSRSFRMLVMVTILLTTVLPAQTTVPQKINYQGYLTNTAGDPYTGTSEMIFSLCDAASGGSCPWTETQSVSVSKGIFNVTLGAVTPITLPFDTPYYLNIQVGGESMSARQPLTSVGYAFRAESANSVTSATSGNTADAIVIRDASGNFSAGTINASSIALRDQSAAPGNLVTLSAPAAVSGSYTLRFPAADGSAGHSLNTDGSGNLSFGPPSLPILGSTVTIGTNATTDTDGIAVGVSANGNASGLAVGYQANGANRSAALGYMANAYAGGAINSGSVAIGYRSNANSRSADYSGGVAIGYMANARANADDYGAGGVAIGRSANAYVFGVAVGGSRPKYVAGMPDDDASWMGHTIGYYEGTAVGYAAWGVQQGAALGYAANAYVTGTAVGYRANSGNQGRSFAKGGYSRSMRYNEEWKGADTLSVDPNTLELTGYNKYGYGQVNFNGVTVNATATEIFLGNTTFKRFQLQDNSGVNFTAHVVAINTMTGDTSVWQVAGGIKRRAGAATTAIIGSVQTLLSQTQGALTTAPAFKADTTNGSLKVTVTGVAASMVSWNVMLQYSEVRE